MATTKEFDVRIKAKRDTEANWTTNNPVLLNGEVIIVDTTGGVRYKVGDGTKTFTQLEYDDEALRTLISEKADKSNYVNATLTAASWSSNTYSFENTYPKASYDLELQISKTATLTQANAFSAAVICGSQSDNIIEALNGSPTVDIPVVLKVTAK